MGSKINIVDGLKPYDEWLVSIPVEYREETGIPFRPILHNPLFPLSTYEKGGSYIYYLPVTTQESHKAGSEIWGFPKVHREVKCEENKAYKTCQLFHNGTFEMSLEVKKLDVSHQEEREFSYCSYTEKGNELLRTCIPASGKYDYTNFGKATVKFGQGKVPEFLRTLSIDPNSPLQVFMGEISHSQLPLEYERLK
jgi:hypothetical protein